jgi:hypothetical protein
LSPNRALDERGWELTEDMVDMETLAKMFDEAASSRRKTRVEGSETLLVLTPW